ncbi:unnamed protein product [Caenorhabditis auriculariae]|uniref:T20D4.11-like domain-containing protein n=1 Tax=Caenorhabditis auriculariae TaxID=2777116 RepID=A0A8S1HDU9_9PELO|nr:unnamed protein product [Caenorhabditis auriculariae]
MTLLIASSLFFLLVTPSASISSDYNVLEQCNGSDVLELSFCFIPFIGVDLTKVSQLTRGKALVHLQECRTAEKCVGESSCGRILKADKMVNAFCDALHYFATAFAPCMRKLERNPSVCLAGLPSVFDGFKSETANEDRGRLCKSWKKSMSCIRQEVTTVCGERYWTPIRKIVDRVSRFSLEMRCELSDVNETSVDF